MTGFDAARLALEAATGGRNTLLPDDLGLPSVMVRLPCFRWSDVLEDGEDRVCEAFIVNGQVKNCLYISKYLNLIEQERAYSLPGRDPAHTLSLDEARRACARKGPGWHLFTNAEWSALAHWCRRNGFYPRGNNHSGQAWDAPHERGIMAPPDPANPVEHARVLTGSGPAAWTHDGTAEGIYDLNGNVWDLVAGLRLLDGEIQVIPDNDSALNLDEGPDSPHWRAIDLSGRLVPPGSPASWKFDSPAPGNPAPAAARLAAGVRLDTRVENPQYSGPGKGGDHAYSIQPFAELTVRPGLPLPRRLVELGLFPPSSGVGRENLFVRNYGERLALRGGSWYDGPTAGLWELYLRDDRAFIFPDIGFRAAYVEP